MFAITKKMFILSITSIVNAPNHTECVSLNNQKYEIQPTLIKSHYNKCSQESHYYPFVVKEDRCVGNCNTLNDSCNKVSITNKTEDLNIHVCNMITVKVNQKSKILTKDTLSECKCKFDG